jgi:hypothetical protein
LLQEASSFHTPVPLKIFIGVGGKEEEQFGQEARMVKNAEDFAARLNNHDSGAEVKFVEYPRPNPRHRNTRLLLPGTIVHVTGTSSRGKSMKSDGGGVHFHRRYSSLCR